ICLPPPISSDLEPEDGPLEILFEDEHLIVLNKPAGLVVHPAPGNYTGTLVQRLLHHCPDLSGIGGVQRPGIVHRLDKDTSGILVVAKHDQAHQRLSRQFRRHSIHRLYSALVWGNLVTLQGTIEAPIGRHPRDRKMMAIVENGRAATTYWTQLAKWDGLTHICCELETGRTHQIRVHFSSQGHPLVGDPIYGQLGKTKHMPDDVILALKSFPRQALHAAELGFEHPISKEVMEFSVAEPKDFQKLLSLLYEKLPPLT
ncbi:MAG: RluA family pseudouridine synthase, partial [bacterium]